MKTTNKGATNSDNLHRGGSAIRRYPVLAESCFERGFRRAIALWRSGLTVECISHRPEYDESEAGRGMYAACEALMGWHDIARREAKAFGIASSTIETLIDLAAQA